MQVKHMIAIKMQMKIFNKLLSKLNLSNVSKNVSWILFQNVYTMLLGIIITGIVARHYGTEGYGIINFAASFVSLFSFLAIFGTNHIILKDLTEKKYKLGTILGSNLFVRIILALITLFVSQVFALILYDKFTNIIIFLFNINTILCCSDVITYYAQSKIKNKYISISKIISTTVFAILRLVAVFLDLNITLYVITYLIETIIYSILLVVSYLKVKEDDTIKWKVDKKYIFYLLKKSKYYALSALMVIIYLRIDQVMLGTFFTDKSKVGIYSAAVRIAEIWTFVPLSVITSYKPIVIKSKEEDETKYKKNLQKLYNIISCICFVFTLGVIIFGKLGIYILYGSNYLSAYIPLVILVFGIWIGTLGNIHFIWMTCENKEKYSMFYSFCGCIANIILNSILIPKLGILGAAIATLVSQIFSNIIAFLFIKDARCLSIMLLKSMNPLLGIKELKKGKKR